MVFAWNRLRNHCRAGLDVFEDEPEAKPGLLDCDNVVAVPHIASASVWTRAGMVSKGTSVRHHE